MFDTIIDDIVTSTSNAFNGSDTMTLVFFGVAAILIGFRCNSITHIFSHALEALMFTGLLYGIYTIAWPWADAPSNAAAWSDAFGGLWNTFMGFTVFKLLGYYLVMLVGLATVFALKTVITRR